MLSEELRTVAAKKNHVLHSGYMVLRQSRKCEKTLRDSSHPKNTNRMEMLLRFV